MNLENVNIGNSKKEMEMELKIASSDFEKERKV